jgi:hypothetical protein
MIAGNFISLCSKGKLEKAQQWYQDNSSTILRFQVMDAFMSACDNNHLSVAKWLYSVYPSLNIHMNTDHVFYYACESNHMEIANWLISLSKVHTNTSYYQYCTIAFANGHNHLIKDIASRVPNFNVSYHNHHLFHSAMNIRRVNFQWSVKAAEMIEWLQEMKPWVYKITYNPNADFDYYDTFDHWNATYYPEKDTTQERNWQLRKYPVYISSNSCPVPNKKSILYKLPTDLSRMVISYI